MQNLFRFCVRLKCSPCSSPNRSLRGRESLLFTPVQFPEAVLREGVSIRAVSTTQSKHSPSKVKIDKTFGSDPPGSEPSGSDPFLLLRPEVGGLVGDIHKLLRQHSNSNEDLVEMSQYYFDGKGKSLRPVIALCIAKAYNIHTNRMDETTVENQKKVALISEMIHTASLVHDDILDHAETRRGKESVNLRWDLRRSTMVGDYILGVGSMLLASIQNPDVVQILSQVLADLVEGEFMQLQNNKEEEEERFENYLNKSFNKTASLMAYCCKANVVLAGGSSGDVENSFQYGRNIGIAFQLVDDLLDFSASADQLGKPAAADLQLGLATAPVLFAARQFKQLDDLIARRFSQAGDVTTAFELVQASTGLQDTRNLAREHCDKAVAALSDVKDSEYKAALVNLCDKVITRLN